MADEYSKSVAMIAADQDRRALSEAEARGYARGVEDAAKIVDAAGHGWWAGVAIRALLKPKGEAK